MYAYYVCVYVCVRLCLYISICNICMYMCKYTLYICMHNMYILYTGMYTGLLVSLKHETISWNHHPKYSHMPNAEYWWLSHAEPLISGRTWSDRINCDPNLGEWPRFIDPGLGWRNDWCHWSPRVQSSMWCHMWHDMA